MPRGHQDHQKQETLLAPSADRGPAPRADEPYRHCRQVPRRQVEASLHVEEPPLPRLRAPVLQPGVNPIKNFFSSFSLHTGNKNPNCLSLASLSSLA